LKFYDKISLHSNFKEVDKINFKKVKKCYHNQHDTQTDQSARILDECFIFIDASFSKKQTMITLLMTSSEIVTSTEIMTSTDIMISMMFIEKDETAAA
jgi:ABC-type ATPase involved in cell division